MNIRAGTIVMWDDINFIDIIVSVDEGKNRIDYFSTECISGSKLEFIDEPLDYYVRSIVSFPPRKVLE